MVPVPFDPWNAYEQSNKPGVTRIALRVAPILPNFWLRYRLAKFTIGEMTVDATAAPELAPPAPWAKYEFQRLPSELGLSYMGRSQVVTWEFPLNRPPPQPLDVKLDLSEALRNPDLPAAPVIRFALTRWTQGYP